jgi:nitroimidazol reductase NimA-like FMN-containing flavoprotein (pyridoxamine 5'-phosphate oxidase superfamily)
MRRSDKEIADSNIVQDVLVNSQICRLGLVDKGEAYIVPVNYAFKDGYIYVHSAAEGRKIELLKKNPTVTFEVEYSSEIVKGEVPCKWGTKYRSIMGRGTVVIHDDIESKRNGLDLIMKKYGGEVSPQYDESGLAKVVLLKIKVESLSAKQSGNW